jgi:hypothetical protein
MRDRLPSENDRQYLAYTCYRDLGLNRSLLAAQRLYDQETGNGDLDSPKKTASGTLKGWAKVYNWEERSRDWDLTQGQKRVEMLQQVDKNNYMASLEAFQQSIETIGKSSLAVAKAAMNIAQGQVEILERESIDGKLLNKDQLENLSTVLKCSRDTVAVLAGGSSALHDAYALVDIGDAIRKMEESRQK